MKKSERNRTIQNNEISEIRTFTLGGYPQKVMLDGKSKENPVVICLHGGPGSPVPFSVGCRGLFPEITEKLTLICWDQLGCGINNRSIDDSFTIRNFTDMTNDLIKEVRNLFPKNKLLLFGISWGSILALKSSLDSQALIDGVVVYGQVLSDLTFNKEVFDFLNASPMPKRKKRDLKKLFSRKNKKYGQKIMILLKNYTEAYQTKTEKNSSMRDIFWGLIKSPDYKFKDFKAIVINGYMKNNSLFNELFNIDLKAGLSKIKIPYTVIQGEKDMVTPTKTVTESLKEFNNDNIRLITVSNNGHIPNDSGMDTILHELMDF